MTRKQPERQNIRRYRYQTDPVGAQPVVHRRASRREEGFQEPRTYVVTTPTGRRVTAPHRAVRPLSAAERHARFRGPQRAQQPTRGRLVARTFAQTGRPAPIGQMRTNKPLPYRRGGSRVQVRRRRTGAGFWRKLFGFLAVLAVLGIGLGLALSNPTFHVQQVQVRGTQNAGLIAAIQHAGIQGQNIFLLNRGTLLGRLESLPLVASASLEVQLPNTVMVVIHERVPVLLWQSGHTTFGLGQDGIVIAPMNVGTGLITVVDQRQGVSVHSGTRIDPLQVAFAQQLVRQLAGVQGVAPFNLQYVNRLTIDGHTEPANQAGAGCYVVVSAQGWLAYMGDAVNSNSLANRILELEQILSIAQQDHVQLAAIDLRFGLRPTYTLKSS